MRLFKSLILAFILIIGLFGVFIITHELYHLLTIPGTATGICFGTCGVVDKGIMISGLTWIPYKNTNSLNDFNLQNNELQAYLAGIFSTVIAGILVIYSLKKTISSIPRAQT